MKSLHLMLALLVFSLFISGKEQHDYYVSVTEIQYAKEEQSLQIISQIFIDDFETLLRKRYDETIILAPDNNPESIESYMQRYLEDRLNIKVNGSAVNFKFIGKEYKEDITYCYLEIKNISNIKSLEVTNRLLFDILPEQQNIVRLKLLNKNRSFLLLPDNDNCMLNFN
jgi:5S rRNA maturation endonuclease (ribonuclease M5)